MADAPPSEKLSADELALVKAAGAGDLQQVKKLLAEGVSPDVRDSETASRTAGQRGAEMNPRNSS